MTLLSITNTVADEVGLEKPATIIGNTNETARRMLAQVRAVCAGLIRGKHSWTFLSALHAFNTVDGTATYALPADYYRQIDNTTWDRANFWKYRGPVSAQEWQTIKSGLIDSTALRKRFRLRIDTTNLANRFEIDPTPSAVEAQVFEFISLFHVLDTSDSNARIADFGADDDVTLFDDYLIERGVIWRMLNRAGQPYIEERAEFDSLLGTAQAHDGGAPTLHLGEPAAFFAAVTQDGNFTL